MRQNFVHNLQQLQNRIFQMGEMVNTALRLAVEGLKMRQLLLAQQVIAGDVQVNHERQAIEEEALTLIATQGPVANDLRLIAGIMYISTELERMGDHAKGIARITEMLGSEPLVYPLVDIPVMAGKCRQMLEEALKAFIRLDAVAAAEIARKDEEIDELYNAIYLDLIQVMSNDASTTKRATYLLWVAHNLERYADRVVNICERTIFVATGQTADFQTQMNG